MNWKDRIEVNSAVLAGKPIIKGSRISSGVEFSPLQYLDLKNTKLSGEIVIHLNWKHATIAESSIPEITVNKAASGNLTLNSAFKSKAIGLVKGGWLPSGLAVQGNMIILPDRNIVTNIRGRFRSGVKKNDGDKDFLDFISGEGIRINPMLFPLEGNLMKFPTREQVEQQLEEVVVALRSALPSAELVPADKGGLQGIVGLLDDSRGNMERELDFLMQIAPKLESPTSARKRDSLWGEVLDIARQCDLSLKSLVVIAALSSILVPNGKSPAKRVLKLERDYTVEKAYNALADIRSLALLIGLFALFPEQRFMLCTEDKNLALFWAGIRASDFDWTGEHANFKISPVDELLPGISSAQRSIFLGANG
jgi:hypothetical protein